MNYISAEPFAAANMPTISKRGESSQIHYTTPETTSAFRYPSTDLYKSWSTNNSRPSRIEGMHLAQLSPSVPDPITNNEMDEWLCFDEDYEMGPDLSSYGDPNLQWSFPPSFSSSGMPSLTSKINPPPSRRLGSLPVSASRSSLQFNPTVFDQDGSSVHYPIGPELGNYDNYGSEPPFTFFDGRGHFPLEFDFPDKPTSHLVSLDGRPLLPPLLTTSDFIANQYSAPGLGSNDLSPISPLSSFSSPSSSPSSSPELVIQTSIPLHQPRPQRRIPIVSLSALASACEAPPKLQRPDQQLQEQSSQALLSPVALESPMDLSLPQFHSAGFFVESERDRWKGPGAHSSNTRTDAIACGCGCNAAYTLS